MFVCDVYLGVCICGVLGYGMCVYVVYIYEVCVCGLMCEWCGISVCMHALCMCGMYICVCSVVCIYEMCVFVECIWDIYACGLVYVIYTHVCVVWCSMSVCMFLYMGCVYVVWCVYLGNVCGMCVMWYICV